MGVKKNAEDTASVLKQHFQYNELFVTSIFDMEGILSSYNFTYQYVTFVLCVLISLLCAWGNTDVFYRICFLLTF